MRRSAALIGALAAAVAGAPAQALPELRISMPSEPYEGQYAPVYVDAFQEPGKLLYRFDALIHNDGTTLDLYREAAPDSDPGFVRMGLSPGAAGRYASQREFQYVDITGLAPGTPAAAVVRPPLRSPASR